MKKVFKVIGLVVLGFLLILGGWVGFVAFSGVPKYDVQKIDLKVESTPARVERGRKLAKVLCVQCHLDKETKTLSGTHMADLPKEFGVAYSRNITNHPTKGIGSWTDGDIAFALRTGIQPKTGDYLPPWMPKFVHMSEEDIHSIIAFLRSDDPLVAAVDKDNRPSEPSLMAKILSRTVFEVFEYPKSVIPQPDTNNLVEYGQYLVYNYDCWTCHSGDFTKMDPKDPSKSFDFLAGGNRMADLNDKGLSTANLTPDKTTGIGNWSEAQFVSTMTTGITPAGKIMRYPMTRHPAVSEGEFKAIYAYLRTVPAITKDELPADPYPDANSGSQARQLYHKYECIRCHGATGKLAADLLTANDKYPEDSVLVDVILNIGKYTPEAYMPLYNGHMSQADAVALAAYVRGLGKKKGA